MKYMITNKEKPLNHPINVVHADLESFVLYSDSGLKESFFLYSDVDIQLVEVDGVPEILENFRVVLNQEKEKMASSSKQPTQQQNDNEGQKNEVIN